MTSDLIDKYLTESYISIKKNIDTKYKIYQAAIDKIKANPSSFINYKDLLLAIALDFFKLLKNLILFYWTVFFNYILPCVYTIINSQQFKAVKKNILLTLGLNPSLSFKDYFTKICHSKITARIIIGLLIASIPITIMYYLFKLIGINILLEILSLASQLLYLGFCFIIFNINLLLSCINAVLYLSANIILPIILETLTVCLPIIGNSIIFSLGFIFNTIFVLFNISSTCLEELVSNILSISLITISTQSLNSAHIVASMGINSHLILGASSAVLIIYVLYKVINSEIVKPQITNVKNHMIAFSLNPKYEVAMMLIKLLQISGQLKPSSTQSPTNKSASLFSFGTKTDGENANNDDRNNSALTIVPLKP